MFEIKVVEKIETHILCSIPLFEDGAVCEIMWENIIDPGKLQMTIWRMRIARWIPKSTSTHLEYVILTAFARQQLLDERTSIARYTYIACLVLSKLNQHYQCLVAGLCG